MPGIKTLFCSSICFIYVTALTAQSVPKNKTPTNVVAYQVRQQKQWSYNQLPKNSIQYRSDSKYIPLRDNNVSSSVLSSFPFATPVIKKSFSISAPLLYAPLSSSLQAIPFPIPTLRWDGHMGGYIFGKRPIQSQTLQKIQEQLIPF